MSRLWRPAVAVAFIATSTVWIYAREGSLLHWVAFAGTLGLAVAAGVVFERFGVLLMFAPTLIAIPRGTSNYDSGIPDAMYVFMLGTPVLLTCLLLGIGARNLSRRVRRQATSA